MKKPRRDSYVKGGCCTVKGCAQFAERQCVWGVVAWPRVATSVRVPQGSVHTHGHVVRSNK
ncbi:hypothetical protein M513_12580 [Trichuris suis]|uniref:Uncharacterized protein n=1 Tax=Trichuris suis TaxID=68888 RepID=A0A085LNI3_9BILA|nr:hypothetical protein M513_12580 [Trichuris suis]